MSATFLVGDRNSVKGILGIPYGFLFVEGFIPLLVTVMTRGRLALGKLVETNRLTSDEVAEQCTTFEPPTDFVPSWRYEPCKGEDCEVETPHGQLMPVVEDGEGITVWTFNQAFDEIDRQGERIRPIDAAILLSQLIKANFPADRQALLDAMPADKRELVDRRAADLRDMFAAMWTGFPGDFGVLIDELRERTHQSTPAESVASDPTPTPPPVSADPSDEEDEDYDSSADRGD